LNDTLSYSKQGLQLIEDFEGCKLTAYKCPAGIWTIGYGHTGHDVTPRMTITQPQAEALLAHDIETSVNFVKRVVKVGLNQWQFDALVDLTFNIGVGNFLRSTVLKLINAGKFPQAGMHFADWSMIAGKFSKGLNRRRLTEAELFQHGLLQVAA
jgi:lysozyme